MSEQAVATREQGTNIVLSLSKRWGVTPDNLAKVVKTTVFRGDAARATNEELVAFLQVCDRYDLNPFLREIYAFVGKSGGVFPIVGVDGWVNLVNRDPRFDGVEFLDHLDDKGEMTAITCAMTVKGRVLPVKITEYMAECKRNTEPWQKWPRRMLRHKAYIQCARYSFGYHGLYDEDEAERIQEAMRDTRGPIIAMPLSVAEAAVQGGGNGHELPAEPASMPEGPDTGSGAPPTEGGPPAGVVPSAEEQEAIRKQEQAEAGPETAPEPPKPPVKVDRNAVWTALLRRAKKENKAAGTMLNELAGKHVSGLAGLIDDEVLALGKKLGL